MFGRKKKEPEPVVVPPPDKRKPIAVIYEAPPGDNTRDTRTIQRRRSSDDLFYNPFAEKKIRKRFVARVYCILLVQLLWSFGWALFCTFFEPVKGVMSANFLAFFLPFMLTATALYLILVCCMSVRRSFPLNLILLGIFTIFMTGALATVSAKAKGVAVAGAIGMAIGITLILTLYAAFTPWDVTGCGFIIFMVGLVVTFLCVGLVIAFLLTKMKVLTIILCAVILVMCIILIVYNTQLIIGGRQYELSPEEYVFGAITLYTAIIEMVMALIGLQS